MRTIYHLFRFYRKQGASACLAARRAVHVYRNGF
jgi:hypothetical protein